MTKRELIKRLKIQVSTMKKDGLDKYPEVLCSRADMLIITCADNPFRAAEVFYNDENISALLGNPNREFVVLPDEDGFRVYKGVGK